MSGFDPKGFKLVGDYLSSLNEGSDVPFREAINRTAVGRYYYSAFLQLREVLKGELEKYPPSLRNRDLNDFVGELEGKNPHALIVAFLEVLKEKINDVRIRRAHNSMVYLRALRNAADYDLREKPEIKTPNGKENVNFSSKNCALEAKRRYSFVESLINDNSESNLRHILRVYKAEVVQCIEAVLKRRG
ncbi:MAG: Uncharacterized protein XD43_0532 [Thermococcales archaeon 44_46]|jgi:hypothetical protein|uniref:hypothetical protein n=1 Tax=Thermococcus bergensis TaxID=2689387 RepID=UPI00074AF7AD|nr:hypothetical protein [Thermococcus bergensis]KUJ99804.1 MAG: Uncharacterized protein XD43_0532 [Thermococcales archaeon 44_46]MCA6214093.1 hypothetical protein [Thermococcus bergensis]MDK2782583.1 hypothetical protein [Thermococcaceae archaeon]